MDYGTATMDTVFAPLGHNILACWLFCMSRSHDPQRLNLFARLYPPHLNNLILWQIQRVAFLKFFYLVASGLFLFAVVSSTDSYRKLRSIPPAAVIVATSLLLGVWGSLALYLRLSLERSPLHNRLARLGPTWAEAAQLLNAELAAAPVKLGDAWVTEHWLFKSDHFRLTPQGNRV